MQLRYAMQISPHKKRDNFHQSVLRIFWGKTGYQVVENLQLVRSRKMHRYWSQSGREYQMSPCLSFSSTKVPFLTQFFRCLLNIAIWISPMFVVIFCILNFPWYFLSVSFSFFSILVSNVSVFFVNGTVLLRRSTDPWISVLLLVFFSSFQMFPHLLQWRVFRRLYTRSLAQTGHLNWVAIINLIQVWWWNTSWEWPFGSIKKQVEVCFLII